jgi:hypothetical protein
MVGISVSLALIQRHQANFHITVIGADLIGLLEEEGRGTVLHLDRGLCPKSLWILWIHAV